MSERHWQARRTILFSLKTWPPTSTARQSPNFSSPLPQEGLSNETVNKEVSYGTGNQIMASWFVGMRAVGLLDRGLDRRRAAHSSRPHGPRVGDIHLDCR